MAKMYDFDKYINERRKKSPSFTLFGDVYHLPPTIPYKALLYIQSLTSRNADENVQDQDMLHFFELLFGSSDHIEKWKSDPNFDIDLIAQMIGWVLEQYDTTDPKAPKAQAKNP